MNTRLFDYMQKIIIPAIFHTFEMLIISFTLSLVIGVILASVLIYTHPTRGLKPSYTVYKILDALLSLLRAFPTIILIVALTPVTKALVGTSIGTTAAIVPITLATVPVVAKSIENVLLEVDQNVVLSAKSVGSSNFQILLHVLFSESLPSIVSSMTSASILCLGTTAVAGAIGAGGLGSVALNYGYQRFDDAVMYTIVLILCVIVIGMQKIGNIIYSKLSFK